MRMDAIRGPDVGTLLIRAIRADAAAAGCPIRIESIACRPWASATFIGNRHTVKLAAEIVPDLQGWIAALPEADLVVRGHLIADLAIDRAEATTTHMDVTIAVLTLIEG